MRRFPVNARSVGLLSAGLVAGAVLAGTMSASATDNTSDTTASAEHGPGMGHRGGNGAHGTPASGEAADKVKAAVLATYPDATVDRITSTSDGTYVAHVTKADGSRIHVLLDKDFAITGEHTRGPGGPGGGRGDHGTPVTGEGADKAKAAVLATYPDATVDRITSTSDGTYVAHVTKADGSRIHVLLDKDFAITGEETGRPGGHGGHGGHGGLGGLGGGRHGGPGAQQDGAVPSAAPSAGVAG